MNSRILAAVFSSLISQLLVLILLLFPSSISNLLPLLTSSFSTSQQLLFHPLLNHFLSAAEIPVAAVTLLSFSRKRKRTRSPDSDDPEGQIRLRGSSVVPKNPDGFKHLFRMNSSTFEWLCGLLEPLLECRDPGHSPLNLPSETRLGIGLFRLATGSDYQEISRRFHVSDSVAKFCVKQLCRVLCTNYRFWVGFPSPTELLSVAAQFESLSGLPNCCGIIDFVRFKIANTEGKESKDAEEGGDAIGTQIVVDASSRILSIAAGFRGKKNDFTVLKSSTLYKDIEEGLLMNSGQMYVDNVAVPQYFVGDDGYPLLPWLLVPFVDPLGGSSEENFNNVIRRMRISMLKAVASLRGWGVLSRPIEAEFKAAVANLGACSILHNMLITREDYSAFCAEICDSTVPDGRFNYNVEDLNDKGGTIRSVLVNKAKRF